MGLIEKINKFCNGFLVIYTAEERKRINAMHRNLDDNGFKETHNPATGFTMNGAVDGAGNNYGCSSGMDYSSSTNNHMDYSRDPFNNFDTKYY